jgi:flavodoxin
MTMGEKKCLVAYYSRTGTTRQVAEAVAKELGADLEEIVDRKKRRGPMGFVIGGKDAATKKLTEIDEPRSDPASYALVVIGTPVWAGTMCPAVRTYITRVKDTLPDVAFILTTGGSGVSRTFADMAELCGKEPVAQMGLTAKQVRKEDCSARVKEFVGQVG